MKKMILTAMIFLGMAFMSAAQNLTVQYNIGHYPTLGGYVFQLSADKKHGLVAETKDQGNWSWYAAKEIMKLDCVHSPDGVKFSDWRLPTKAELNTMYTKKNAIGGFSNGFYWSSNAESNDNAWYQNFSNGVQTAHLRLNQLRVRAVRAF